MAISSPQGSQREKSMKPVPLPAIAISIGVALGLVWWLLRPALPIAVGMVAWMVSGAVVGSSEMNAADLSLEEQPYSRLRVSPVDDEWKPEKTVPVIHTAMEQGVR
jgi:branched-chain amino acid transport system substrate-binding protein